MSGSPFSPEYVAGPIQELLTSERKAEVHRRLLLHLQKIVERYERVYLAPEQLASFRRQAITKERFEHFHNWIKKLSERSFSLSADLSLQEGRLEEDVVHAAMLYEGLRDLVANRPLTGKIYEWYGEYPLAPNEFRISKKNLMTWSCLRSRHELKTLFNIDEASEEYVQGRNTRDFILTNEDVFSLGYAVDDLVKRQALLRSVHPLRSFESLPPAKIFSIQDLIEQRKKDGAPHPDQVTTGELFEAFEAANVRPANLRELLAYSKAYWKPDQSLTPEETAQCAGVHKILAFGSAFYDSNSGHQRRVPCLLVGFPNMRRLDSEFLNFYWCSTDTVLVFRKENS